MKLVSLFLFSIAAYGEAIMGGSADSNGVLVNYETRVEPGSPSIRKHGGGTLTEKDTIKRHLCNFDNNTYFGYDLVAEALPDGRYRLRFSPLSITTDKMAEIFEGIKWTSLSLPGGAATMEVRGGERVALDLFVNPSTGQKITDYLTIKSEERQQINVAGPARDFQPEDAIIEISSPQVTVDGKPLASLKGSVSGHAVWVDLPQHGRFLFSVVPRPDLGMQRLGEIRGTTVTWRHASREYSIKTDKRITSGSRAHNLYVAHVTRSFDGFGMSAGDKLEAALRP